MKALQSSEHLYSVPTQRWCRLGYQHDDCCYYHLTQELNPLSWLSCHSSIPPLLSLNWYSLSVTSSFLIDSVIWTFRWYCNAKISYIFGVTKALAHYYELYSLMLTRNDYNRVRSMQWSRNVGCNKTEVSLSKPYSLGRLYSEKKIIFHYNSAFHG